MSLNSIRREGNEEIKSRFVSFFSYDLTPSKYANDFYIQRLITSNPYNPKLSFTTYYTEPVRKFVGKWKQKIIETIRAGTHEFSWQCLEDFRQSFETFDLHISVEANLRELTQIPVPKFVASYKVRKLSSWTLFTYPSTDDDSRLESNLYTPFSLSLRYKCYDTMRMFDIYIKKYFPRNVHAWSNK